MKVLEVNRGQFIRIEPEPTGELFGSYLCAGDALNAASQLVSLTVVCGGIGEYSNFPRALIRTLTKSAFEKV